MTDDIQTGPVMDGATDATNEQKLAGLHEQIEHDHAGESDDAKAEHLQRRLDETGVVDTGAEPEDPAINP